MKRENAETLNLYPQQNVWIEDEKELFTQGIIVSIDSKGAKVSVKGELLTFPIQKLHPSNPPKFSKVEDMADLTYLNEASILHNIEQRYHSDLVYTYSGLFLVAVNPYTELEPQNDRLIMRYANSKRGESAPHIYAVASDAYSRMTTTGVDQSILITGESGAGKTESTKRVIHFLTTISRTHTTTIGKKIMATTPVVEAFGNAKTIRNNNSSRFGKFIRLLFNANGNLSGGRIDHYLLEKSRVTHRVPWEFNFHVFYIVAEGMTDSYVSRLPKLPKTLRYLSAQHAVSQKERTAQFKELIASLKIIEFEEKTIIDILKSVIAVLLLGNIEFYDDDKEYGHVANEEVVYTLCNLLETDPKRFCSMILEPSHVVGKEIVYRRRSSQQATLVVDAFARFLYVRIFDYVIARINNSILPRCPTTNFIGVLDIAGFEIFDINGFEQLCINHTNEKLQQFFNNHMFTLEQELYRNENISWDFIDFGLDLQPTIDRIEKSNPVGIFACIDEECLFPQATDTSFIQKMKALYGTHDELMRFHWLRNSFSLKHYATSVEYTVDSWISKNKDMLTSEIVLFMQKESSEFFSHLCKPRKHEQYKGIFGTHLQKHREQINELMELLRNTNPHFVRCILPNVKKATHTFDKAMVIKQLRCNGVLEGIRISRLGFPNRLTFSNFNSRYNVLAPVGVSLNSKEGCVTLMTKLNLGETQYKIGKTKVFLKTGVLALLEDMRNRCIEKDVLLLQCFSRMFTEHERLLRSLRVHSALTKIALSIRKSSVLNESPLILLIRNILRRKRKQREPQEQFMKLCTYYEREIKELKNNVSQQRMKNSVRKELIAQLETENSRHAKTIRREKLENAFRLNEINAYKKSTLNTIKWMNHLKTSQDAQIELVNEEKETLLKAGLQGHALQRANREHELMTRAKLRGIEFFIVEKFSNEELNHLKQRLVSLSEKIQDLRSNKNFISSIETKLPFFRKIVTDMTDCASRVKALATPLSALYELCEKEILERIKTEKSVYETGKSYKECKQRLVESERAVEQERKSLHYSQTRYDKLLNESTVKDGYISDLSNSLESVSLNLERIKEENSVSMANVSFLSGKLQSAFTKLANRVSALEEEKTVFRRMLNLSLENNNEIVLSSLTSYKFSIVSLVEDLNNRVNRAVRSVALLKETQKSTAMERNANEMSLILRLDELQNENDKLREKLRGYENKTIDSASSNVKILSTLRQINDTLEKTGETTNVVGERLNLLGGLIESVVSGAGKDKKRIDLAMKILNS